MPTPLEGYPGCAITVWHDGVEMPLTWAGDSPHVEYQISHDAPLVCSVEPTVRDHALSFIPVPEPSQWVALVVGFIALACMRAILTSRERKDDRQDRGQ